MSNMFPSKRLSDKGRPDRESDNGTKKQSSEEAAEQHAAMEFAYIIEYLELINEMEHYLVLYDLLGAGVMDGMRLSKALREICVSREISFLPERMEMLAGYSNYAYMRRKWKKEQRRQIRLSRLAKTTDNEGDELQIATKEAFPEWKDVIIRITNFGKPLWECLCKGELFVGDWMPELGRFLD